MQERTIINALIQVRREGYGTEAQGYAEALLRLYGAEPPPIHRKSPDRQFGPGQLRRAILQALKGGPKTIREIAAEVHEAKPEIGYEAAYKRAGIALARYRGDGVVTRGGGVWRLAP